MKGAAEDNTVSKGGPKHPPTDVTYSTEAHFNEGQTAQ